MQKIFGKWKFPLDKVCSNAYTELVATKVVIKIAMKKGTKLTDNPKDYMLRVRMDTETVDKLDFLCEKRNATRSQIVRDSIEKEYQKEK